MNDLITFFTKSPQNRRKYARRAGPFPAMVAINSQWGPCACLDISGSGVGIIASVSVPEEVNLKIKLDARTVAVRAKRVWQKPGTSGGKPAWRYGMAFTGISADDWDAVIRFSNNQSVAEAPNKAQKDLELVRMQADDVARLIPKKLQDTMLAMLVRRGRLAPLDDKHPLVQYAYGGVIKRGATAVHRLSIHSRVRDPATGEIRDFDTLFTFDDQGRDIQVDD